MRQAAARPTAKPVLAVCGLSREAGIVGGDGVQAVAAPPVSLAVRLNELDGAAFSAVVSFGLAGGLDQALAAGDVVIATDIAAGGKRWLCDEALSERLTHLLGDNRIKPRRVPLAAVDHPLLTATEKQAFGRKHNAAAVDTESHLAAEFADRNALPFVTLRAICDTADRNLPPLAMRAIGSDGRLDLPAIAAELVRRPGQLLLLPGTAFSTAKAMRTLGRVRRRLGTGLGLLG